MIIINNNFYRYRIFSSNNLLLLYLIIIFCAFKIYIVEAHYIENEENVESKVIDKDAVDSIINKDNVNEKNIGGGNTNKDIEDIKTDKELDAFKSLLNGFEIIKTEENNEEEKNESNIGDIFDNLAFGLLNDIFDNRTNEEVSNNDRDRPKNQEDISNKMVDNKLIGNEGKIVDNKSTSEEEKKVDNKNTNEEEKKVENKNTSEEEKKLDNKNKSEEEKKLDNKNKSEEEKKLNNKNKSEEEKKLDNKNKSEEEKTVDNKSTSEDNKTVKNKNINKEDKMVDGNSKEEIKNENDVDVNNNTEENVKKIKLVTEHKTYQDGKNQKSSNEDNVSDEDLKSFIKIFIEGDDGGDDDKKEIEDSLFKQAKEAIENSQSKNQNSSLDELAKAKEHAIEKGPKFLENKNKQNLNNNDLDGVFKVEEAFIYKCLFDQECTNFKGYTPDIAYCNKTRRRCTNYCYVQKACLSDSDCSTTCGSWCLKEDEMVFGRCVMTFDEGDFCMESWRMCGEGLFCNENTYVCEKTRIPLTFTRIDSQESLLSIIVFLIIAIYLIKKSRNNNFVTYFSGYSLNEYCNNVQEYDPLPEYQRTETLNPEEMNDLVGPPPETGAPSNVDEPGYIAGDDTEPLYCGYYDENNHSVNCNYIPVRHEEPIANNNGEVNVHIPSTSSMSDSNEINEPPPDYEE